MSVTEDYYANYRMLFNHPGWKQFLKDIQETKDSMIMSTFDTCSTERELYFTKGKVHSYDAVLSFEEGIKALEETIDDIRI